MPKGVPMSPEDLQEAARVYTRTGSYSEAARAIGAPDPSTVRQALLRHQHTTRHQLHARAVAKGERLGRRALLSSIARLDRYLTIAVGAPLAAGAGSEAPALPSLIEPKDVAALERTLQGAAQSLTSLAESLDRRKTARATRRKLQAEIKALDKGPLTAEQLLVLLAAAPRETVFQALTLLSERERRGLPEGAHQEPALNAPSPQDP